MSSRSPSASGLLPMPGSPSSSWALYSARLKNLVKHPNMRVIVAFWLLGLINNVLYVIILSAAQDLVGSLPKGVVLLADVVPSFFTKLIAPYFIHRIPYPIRVLIFIALSAGGMLMIAITPPSKSVPVKMVGVILASLSSGGGELSFLGLTHYYGHMSLAGWGSGTGAAGLVGAGLYVLLTDWWGFTVQQSLLFSACLPAIMFVSFFFVLPLDPLRQGSALKEYDAVPERDVEDEVDADQTEQEIAASTSALLVPEPSVLSANTAYAITRGEANSLRNNLRRAKALFIPYMAPLLLVYVAEYTINQGVSPTLLFPLESSPFKEFREFYPFYGFLYQVGVFISRSSTSFIRVHYLYLPSLLQVANLVLLTLHAIFFFIPSVYIVFIIIFWEGLLGGAVYVNCFAEIMENVPAEEREFSLSATTVSDSGGICIAGLISIVMETSLCDYQVAHGRDWCQRAAVSHGRGL
ncbi:Batten's disease protein Cln3 [Trichoderma velutinum]